MNEGIKKYLPSKKFAVTVGSILVLLGIILLAKHTIVKKRTAAENQATIEENIYNGNLVAISDLAEKDSDADGLADWEESLWGTDPGKTDTDNDGISDKKEVDQKKAGLDAASDSATEGEALTETETFSRELFASIAALKESGNFNSSSLQDLAQTISQNAGDEQIMLDSYVGADIKVTQATPASISTYYKALFSVLQKYDNAGFGTELAKIEAGLEAEDSEKINELHAIAAAYKNLSEDLMHMTAPADAVAMHLESANSANNISVSLENATHIYDNALRGLIGLSQYETENTRFEKSLENLESYFKKNGII